MTTPNQLDVMRALLTIAAVHNGATKEQGIAAFKHIVDSGDLKLGVSEICALACALAAQAEGRTAIKPDTDINGERMTLADGRIVDVNGPWPTVLLWLTPFKVLFRAPDTGWLYGIPYEMKKDVGQEPRHLWQSRELKIVGAQSGVNDPGPREGWVLIDEQKPEVQLALAPLKPLGMVPTYGYEWVRLHEADCPCASCEAAR